MSKFISTIINILSKKEKIIITLCLAVILVVSVVSWQYNILHNTVIAANYGGKYTEGMIVSSQESIKPVIDKLTKIGLVRFDKDGNIIPALAEKWEISEDQKTYTFKLQKFVSSAEIAEIIKQEKDKWQEQKIEIKTPDQNTIQFVLAQPFSPFLASLSEELFPYGPYTLSSETKQDISFTARGDFFLGKPYITEIVINIYPNSTNLNQALKNKEIDGVAEVENNLSISDKLNIYQLILPRYVMLFFNLNSANFSDKNVRVKLAKGEKLDKEISFDVVTLNSEQYLAKANEIKAKWEPLGAKANIIAKDAKDLQTQVIPERKYDALIYGLNYGTDPDPYPFWHSSQLAGGLNLSNFSDVDADKLLEEARQTTNQDERNKKYQEFQKIFDDQVPAIQLEQINWQYAVTKNIKGIVSTHQGFSSSDRFFEVWSWHINERRIRK